jgi:hypothetical protein
MRFLKIRPAEPLDAGLRLVGVSLAGGSLAFAFHMTTAPDRAPEIAGIEHLAIYARPASSTALQKGRAVRDVDFTPIGSTRSAHPERILPGYEILEADGQSATIRLPEGRVTRVTSGSRLAGLGAVSSIKQRGGKWAIVTQAGLILER